MNGLRISKDIKEFNFEIIRQYLTLQSWHQDTPVEVIKRAVQNSDSYALLTGSGEQIGFVRLITNSTETYLADLFIVESYQGNQLENLLLEAVKSEMNSSKRKSYQPVNFYQKLFNRAYETHQAQLSTAGYSH